MSESIDRALRELSAELGPTDEDRLVTWNALQEAMAAERANELDVQARRPRRWTGPAVASIAAVGLAVTLATAQLIGPVGAEAALLEIAEAAEIVDPDTIADGTFWYIHSEGTRMGTFTAQGQHPNEEAYLLPYVRETWTGADGTLHLRTVTGEPAFFTADAEAAYFDADMDSIDGVGKTTVETMTNVGSILDEGPWPTEPEALAQALSERLPDTTDTSETIAMLNGALDFVRRPETPPALRAAALRVIAGLNLDLVERTDDGGGTFAVSDEARNTIRQTVTLDGQGNLLQESTVLVDGDPALQVPPGTPLQDTHYGPRTKVDGLPDS